jgi:hypothetical protein
MLVRRRMQVEFIGCGEFHRGDSWVPSESLAEVTMRPLTEFDRLYDTRKQSGPDNDIITAPGGLLKWRSELWRKSGCGWCSL